MNTKKKCKVKKINSQRVPFDQKRALIVENMQNCFFKGGSMGFVKKVEEKRLVEYINKLINYHTLEEKYSNASLTGMGKERDKINEMFGKNKDGLKQTGSRKKYYFDYIIFTQTSNVPDHFTFASTHYLRTTNFKFFSEINEDRESYYDCSKDKIPKCQGNLFLLPDHALTDGSDSHFDKGKKLHGIEFHPDLDISSLYRPNNQFDEQVFINKPEYHNRGFITTKGSVNRAPYSAFKNTKNEDTCLSDFLKKNNVGIIAVCGIGRENSIKKTLLDSLKYGFIKERILIYNASMPMLVQPISKKNRDVAMARKDNTWSRELKKKGIVTIDSEEILKDKERVETNHDKKKVSQGINSLVSIFKNSRPNPVSDFNNYQNTLQKRKKKSKKKNNNRN